MEIRIIIKRAAATIKHPHPCQMGLLGGSIALLLSKACFKSFGISFKEYDFLQWVHSSTVVLDSGNKGIQKR